MPLTELGGKKVFLGGVLNDWDTTGLKAEQKLKISKVTPKSPKEEPEWCIVF